jgi:hypothetical protein
MDMSDGWDGNAGRNLRLGAADPKKHDDGSRRRCEWRGDIPPLIALSGRQLAALAVAATFLVAAAPTASAASPANLFRRALANHSTAPSYVLITLVSPNGQSRREVAIPAPFLLGAIHTEHHLKYDDAGTARAEQIALAQQDRVFQFKDRRAVRNVQPRYTEEQLSAMRERLKNETASSLFAGFNAGSRPLHKLYERPRFRDYDALRDAIAHVLLERGLLAGHGDIVASLTVSE